VSRPETMESDARVNQPTPQIDYEIRSADDFRKLRDLWETLPRIPKLIQADEAPVISRSANQTVRLALSSEESAGAVQVCHVVLQPGLGAPIHHQPQEDELWFAVEGEVVWTVGNLTRTVRKGGFAYVPRNTTHAFENAGSEPAVMFALNIPGGHERGFMAGAAMRAAGCPTDDVRAALKDYDFIFHQLGGDPAKS
jgi:mannose-6-phosphate isomerase-like protein (cupin superfamily)